MNKRTLESYIGKRIRLTADYNSNQPTGTVYKAEDRDPGVLLYVNLDNGGTSLPWAYDNIIGYRQCTLIGEEFNHIPFL